MIRKGLLPLLALAGAILPFNALALTKDTFQFVSSPMAKPVVNLPDPNCIRPANDADGDGYAESGATAGVYVEYEGMECPAPYISPDHANDCDDNDADTHPNAVEVAGDGLDQDCDGIADDPHVNYDEDASRVTSSSVNFTLVTKDANTVLNGTSHYEVEYFALKNSSTHTVTAITALPSVTGAGLRQYSITVSGLSPATVYAFKVTLYRQNLDGSFSYVTEQGDWFYSTTDGASFGDAEHERTRIVLKGLAELGDSQLGRVGYAGGRDPDGTRYGADLDELWCSEFYSWVTDEWLGFYADGFDSSQDIIDFFKAYDAYYAAYYDPATDSATDDRDFEDPAYVQSEARRGDYLAEDSNGDGDIDSNHSAMFLAWDEDTSTTWSLNGNADSRGGYGNYVMVRQDAYSYANAADNDGDTAYRVVGVGHLDCDMLGAACSSFTQIRITGTDTPEIPDDLPTLDELRPTPEL